MPRKASDRAFGFKASGLIRILTASDPEEVLTAMEALGITLSEADPTFRDFLVAIARFFVRPLDIALNALETASQTARSALQVISEISSADFRLGGPGKAAIQRALNSLISDAGTARNALVQERRAFRASIMRADRERVAREVERLFTLDPRGELFQPIEGA